MEISMLEAGLICGRTAVLIGSREKLRIPLIDLPSQHCAAVTDFADKHRHNARCLTLWGPLIGSRLVQSLTQNLWPQLRSLTVSDAPQWVVVKGMSRLTDSLPCLIDIRIANNCLDASVLPKLVMGWSQLEGVGLSRTQLDANAMSAVKHATWPHLEAVDLTFNSLGVAGMQLLVSCSWRYSGTCSSTIHALMFLLYFALLKDNGLHCNICL